MPIGEGSATHMAAGKVTSILVQIMFTTGTWTDVTSWFADEAGMGGRYGRSDEFTEVAPATWGLTLRNSDGRFTPDNPTSPYYPYVVEDVRLRVSVTVGGTTYVRFDGYVDSWSPLFPDGNPDNGVVAIEASDTLSRLARRTFRHEWIEYIRDISQTNATAADAFDFSGSSGSTSFENLGYLPPTATLANVGTARIVPYRTGIGTYEVTTDPSDLRSAGSVTLSPAGTNGPVVLVDTTSTNVTEVLNVDYLFRLPQSDAAPSSTTSILEAWQGSQTPYFRVDVSASGSNAKLRMYDRRTDTYVFDISESGILDGAWHSLTFQNDPAFPTTKTLVYLDDVLVGTYLWSVRAVKTFILGGRMTPSAPGKQTGCVSVELGGFHINAGRLSAQGSLAIPARSTTSACQTRIATLAGYSETYTSLSGSDNRTVAHTALGGRSVLEVMQELARTVGGYVWSPPTGGGVQYALPDALRLSTVAATVATEADESGLSFIRAVDSKPTRVTATAPSAKATAVDEAKEAEGVRRELTVDTCAMDEAGAYNVASWILSQSTTLRLSQLRVNLTTAANNLYAAVFGLTLGARINVTGLPSSILGYTSLPVYAQGWREEYSPDGVEFIFDCTPADMPAEAIFTSSSLGRFCADSTLQLAYPLGSSDTSIRVAPTSTTHPVLSTSAGDYSLDLGIGGERVTCPSAPSSSTRTNLITNPSFETNTTGWGNAFGYTAATLSTSTEQVLDVEGMATGINTRSLKVAWPTASSGQSCAVFATSGLTIGQVYSFSLYVYVPTGAPDVRIMEAFGVGSSVTFTRQTSAGTNDGWARLGMTFTAANTNPVLGIANNAASTVGQVCYVDAVLLEQTTLGVGTYFDGALFGGTWTGTAHGSTSTQPIQTLAGVTRGVSPTVARAHSTAYDDVDVWLTPAFAF